MSGDEMLELERRAERIPHMGGRRIAPFLRRVAGDATPNTAIVELGCWLGAGTAQLAIGLHGRPPGHGVKIHCFDNFSTSESSARKAQDQGVDIVEGQDTLAWVGDTLAPFGADIELHKCMLRYAEWTGEPISVFIDDASKYPHTFYHCLKLFGPSWTMGATILLMDYWLFRKIKGATPQRLQALRCQYEFMQEHEAYFEPVSELTDSSCAAFIYKKPLDFAALPSPPWPASRK